MRGKTYAITYKAFTINLKYILPRRLFPSLGIASIPKRLVADCPMD
jgi:hypothetical protein